MTQAQRDAQYEGAACMSIGMPPKLRYLTLLRARELDVSQSRLIAAAIDGMLKDNNSDSYVNEQLWNDDPAIRLFRLATTRADLLTHNERLLWRRIITDQSLLTDGKLSEEKISQRWPALIVGF